MVTTKAIAKGDQIVSSVVHAEHHRAERSLFSSSIHTVRLRILIYCENTDTSTFTLCLKEHCRSCLKN
jgi:hypothetical protein